MLRLAFTGISLEVYPVAGRGGGVVRCGWAEPLWHRALAWCDRPPGLPGDSSQDGPGGATEFQCRARAGALGAVLAADTAGRPACPRDPQKRD